MHKKIVINVAEHETRVALLEDGNIVGAQVPDGVHVLPDEPQVGPP